MHYAITHSGVMDGQKFLQALLDLRGLNPNAMAKKAGNHALQSTVARFLGGNQSRPSTMQPVADFFGVDVGGFYDPDKAIMELRRLGAMEGPMHPGPVAVQAGPPTLAQALEVVLDAMAQSTAKAELKQLLPMLVETNAAAYRARLGELLGQSLQKQPSIADKLLAVPSEVESPRLSQRATEK